MKAKILVSKYSANLEEKVNQFLHRNRNVFIVKEDFATNDEYFYVILFYKEYSHRGDRRWDKEN